MTRTYEPYSASPAPAAPAAPAAAREGAAGERGATAGYSDATRAAILAAAERYREACVAVKSARAVFDCAFGAPSDEAARIDARRAYYAADDERDAACDALLEAARKAELAELARRAKGAAKGAAK